MEQHHDLRPTHDLVQAARTGDSEAFAALLRRYTPPTTGACARLLALPHDIEDVLQDAALYAFAGLDQLREPGRFGAWFCAIAVNLARRRYRRRPMLSLDAAPPAAEPASAWSSGTPALDDLAIAQELEAATLALLNDSSTINRLALLTQLHGYSLPEVAALLGVPTSTVRGRVYQARQYLQTLLATRLSGRPGTHNPGERSMDQEPSVAMEVVGFVSASSTDGGYVAMLRATDGSIDIPLRLDYVPGEILKLTRAELWPGNAPPAAPALGTGREEQQQALEQAAPAVREVLNLPNEQRG